MRSLFHVSILSQSPSKKSLVCFIKFIDQLVFIYGEDIINRQNGVIKEGKIRAEVFSDR